MSGAAPTMKLYIDGSLCDATSGQSRAVHCPANGCEVGRVAWAGGPDAGRALAGAMQGFETWRQFTPHQRAAWMLRLKQALATREEYLRTLVMQEQGKTWQQTEEDYGLLISSLDYYAQLNLATAANLDHPDPAYSHRLMAEPAGPVVAILAWNFPLLNLGYKLGPALAAGCSIIVKPSPETPLSAYAVGAVCSEIGFPKGVISVLCGSDRDVSEVLVSSRIPAVVTLIGSSRTGRRLYQIGSSSIKKYSMELGGNAPAIVFADANLDVAADVICSLKFSNAGQICVAPNRVLVASPVYEELKDRIIQRARRVRLGFGRHSGATMGPVIHQEARDRLCLLAEESLNDGAKVLYRGVVPPELTAGSFVAPLVLEAAPRRGRLWQEEIFGPLIALYSFQSDDEALALANDTEAGLSSFLFTADESRIARFSRDLRFGEVQVNGVKYGIELPHLGIKQSGVGCDCSPLALDDYLVRKRVTIAAPEGPV